VHLLAIDSSTDRLVLALLTPDGLFTWHSVTARQHGELLVTEVPRLLQSHGIALQDLHGIALGQGPGSFTGLRIGAAFVQALAMAHQLPVVMVDSLLALAMSSGHDRVIVAIKARMGEIYHAVYWRQNGQWQVLSPPTLFSVTHLPPLEEGDYAIAGNGWIFFQEELATCYGSSIKTHYDGSIGAESLLALAQQSFHPDLFLPPESIIPHYLRSSVALPICARMKKKST
jgi:tRNA threonylcarbamoyladenosine biosynthesis protein TsaB